MKGLVSTETYLNWLTLNKPVKACYNHELNVQSNHEME